MLDEPVRYAQMQQGHHDTPWAASTSLDRRAGAAHDGILLDGHDARDAASAISMIEFLIQRLDEAHIDERGVEPIGNLAGRFDQRAERENGKPAASFARDTVRARRGSRSSRRPIGTPGPAPRGYRTAEGADSVVPVKSIWRHSFSSAGAMITMFGMQRRNVRS